MNQLARGQALPRSALMRCRRNHRPRIEACLGRLFLAAGQMRSFTPDHYRVGAGFARGVPLAEAAAEARKRVHLAMQFDLGFSE